ncbi:Mu transposase domain-containing protein [Brevibacterium epidermidis]|uniref:Mu transposase domain-containing protein n=1 Tax=Brevibacterium epidermidis TaxID=1698 RepID=UPI003F896A9B
MGPSSTIPATSTTRILIRSDRSLSTVREEFSTSACPVSNWVSSVGAIPNFYSVPYAHVGTAVDLRMTETTVEIFDGHTRLSTHLLPPAGVINTHHTHDGDLPHGQRQRQTMGRAWRSGMDNSYRARHDDGDQPDLRVCDR